LCRVIFQSSMGNSNREKCNICCLWSSFLDFLRLSVQRIVQVLLYVVVLSGLSVTCWTENCASFAVRGRPFRTLLRLAIRRIVQVSLFVVVLSGLSAVRYTENLCQIAVRGRPFRPFWDLLYGELCKFCYTWSSFPDFLRLAVQRIVLDLLFVVVLSRLRRVCSTKNYARLAWGTKRGFLAISQHHRAVLQAKRGLAYGSGLLLMQDSFCCCLENGAFYLFQANKAGPKI